MDRRAANWTPAFALFISAPSAYADGIALEGLIAAGVVGLLVFLSFVIAVEFVIWMIFASFGWKRTSQIVAVVNVVSLLSGIPVFFTKGYVYSAMLPDDLAGEFRCYPYAFAIVFLLYFVLTAITELAVAVWWIRKKGWSCSARRIALAVGSSNLVSYGLLGGFILCVVSTAFRFDTSAPVSTWARQPAQQIIYCDPVTSHLKSINSDGGNEKLIFPFAMRDYFVSEDLSTCMFLAHDGSWYCASQRATEPVLILKAGSYPLINLAVSPKFDRIALLTKTEEYGHGLTIIDTTTATGKDIDVLIPETVEKLAWSDSDDLLYAQGIKRWQIRLDGAGLGTIEEISKESPVALTKAFGHWRSERSRDDMCNERVAEAFFELESVVTVGRPKPDSRGPWDLERDHWIHSSPKPLSILQARPNRYFNDVAFLSNCDEIVFDDGEFLYLYSITEKKLGTITRGHTWILLNDRFAPSLEIPEN